MTHVVRDNVMINGEYMTARHDGISTKLSIGQYEINEDPFGPNKLPRRYHPFDTGHLGHQITIP